MTSTEAENCPTADLDQFWNDQHDDYIRHKENIIEYKETTILERKRVQCCFVCFSDISGRNNNIQLDSTRSDNNNKRENKITNSSSDVQPKNDKQVMRPRKSIAYSRRPSEEDAINFIKENGITREDLNEWTLNFSSLIKSQKGTQLFRLFCESEFSSENINFYLEVQEFQKLNLTEEASQMKLQSIYDDYISDQSSNQVSITHPMQKQIEDLLISETFSYGELNDILSKINKYVYNVMHRDSYSRFKISTMIVSAKKSFNVVK